MIENKQNPIINTDGIKDTHKKIAAVSPIPEVVNKIYRK